MTTENLLVELFVEELPPKALKKLGDAFAGVLFEQLKAQGLAGADAVLTSFASPRRLAAHVTGVAARAADKAVSQKLMPVAVGLDASGNATPALLKKLGALGADASVVPSLKRAPDGKAEALFYDSTVKGALLVEGLQKALDEALATHNAALPRLQEFILPAGTRAASQAHVCRTVARRAERAVVALGSAETLKDTPRQYLNRLSDLMFVLARVLNRFRTDGSVGDDVYWKSERMAKGAAAGE